MTMNVIQHIELGSAAAQIEFTSIPQTYTDLLVVCSLRHVANAVDATFSFNGNNSNQSTRRLYGGGSGSGTSDSTTDLRYLIVPSSATANTFGNISIYVPNYTASVAKSVSVDSVTEFNNTAAYQQISASLWNNTAAITSIQLRGGSGNLDALSSATLYGITKGSDGTTTVS